MMGKLARAEISRLFTLGDTANTSHAKGAALEDLICYIFEQVPGIRKGVRDTLNAFASEEIDIAFWNTQHVDGFYFLPFVVLVECKNWSKPVDCEAVNWFASKVKRRGQRFGLLIAAKGITGDPNAVTGAREITRTLLAEGFHLIVITRQELEGLTCTDELVRLIEVKLCQLAASGTSF